MATNNNEKLVDIGIAGEPMYCDGMGEIINLGTNFQVTYFCWMMVGGIWQKVIRHHMIRPRTSVLPGSRLEQTLLTLSSPYTESAMQMH